MSSRVELAASLQIGFVLRIYYSRLYFPTVTPMVATVRELFEEGARGRSPPNHPVKFVRGVRQPGRGAFSWRGAPWRVAAVAMRLRAYLIGTASNESGS